MGKWKIEITRGRKEIESLMYDLNSLARSTKQLLGNKDKPGDTMSSIIYSPFNPAITNQNAAALYEQIGANYNWTVTLKNKFGVITDLKAAIVSARETLPVEDLRVTNEEEEKRHKAVMEREKKLNEEKQKQNEEAAVLLGKYPHLKSSTNKYHDNVTAAKNIRIELERAFPGHKFKVRSETNSTSDAVHIDWEDGPTESEVREVTGKYSNGDFDGMTDSYNFKPSAFRDAFGGADYIMRHRSDSFEVRLRLAKELGISQEVDKFGLLVDWQGGREVWRKFSKTSFYVKPSETAPQQTERNELASNTGFKVRDGLRPGYVEILFDSKPDKETIEEMHTCGFRFSNKKGPPRWWGRRDMLTAKYLEQKTAEREQKVPEVEQAPPVVEQEPPKVVLPSKDKEEVPPEEDENVRDAINILSMSDEKPLELKENIMDPESAFFCTVDMAIDKDFVPDEVKKNAFNSNKQGRPLLQKILDTANEGNMLPLEFVGFAKSKDLFPTYGEQDFLKQMKRKKKEFAIFKTKEDFVFIDSPAALVLSETIKVDGYMVSEEGRDHRVPVVAVKNGNVAAVVLAWAYKAQTIYEHLHLLYSIKVREGKIVPFPACA